MYFCLRTLSGLFLVLFYGCKYTENFFVCKQNHSFFG